MSKAFSNLSTTCRQLTSRIAIVLAFAWAGIAHANVDVNSADEVALTEVRGIGPAMAKRIIEVREKGGAFKDAEDLADRVPGVGPKSAANLQDAGLTFGKPAAVPARKDGKAAGKGQEKGSDKTR